MLQSRITKNFSSLRVVFQSKQFTSNKLPKREVDPRDDYIAVGDGIDFADEYDGRHYVDMVKKMAAKKKPPPDLSVHEHFFPKAKIDEKSK